MIPIDHLRLTTSLLIVNVNSHQSRKTFTLLLAISFCAVTTSPLQLVSELKYCTDPPACIDSQQKSESLEDTHYLFIFLSHRLVKPQPGRSSKIIFLALGRRFRFRCSKQFSMTYCEANLNYKRNCSCSPARNRCWINFIQ